MEIYWNLYNKNLAIDWGQFWGIASNSFCHQVVRCRGFRSDDDLAAHPSDDEDEEEDRPDK